MAATIELIALPSPADPNSEATKVNATVPTHMTIKRWEEKPMEGSGPKM